MNKIEKLDEQIKKYKKLMLIDEVFNNTPTNLENLQNPTDNLGWNSDLMETDEEPEMIDVYMSILSQLSDIQAEISNVDMVKRINFIKALLFKFKNNKTEISKTEADELFNYYSTAV